MNLKMKFLVIIFIAMNYSCKNQTKEHEVTTSAQPDTLKKEIQVTKTESTKIDTFKIIEQLQGKWKEIEYPFRTAEFISSTVKFVEEGLESTPKFERFKVSGDCQYDNNNIRDIKISEIILTLPETKRCEKLKVSDDKLTLSGFSTNSNEDYNIVYEKLK